MSLEHAPRGHGTRRAYTLAEFCEAYRISRTQLYKLWRKGEGPRFFHVGVKVLITYEAGDDWARELEETSTEKVTA